MNKVSLTFFERFEILNGVILRRSLNSIFVREYLGPDVPGPNLNWKGSCTKISRKNTNQLAGGRPIAIFAFLMCGNFRKFRPNKKAIPFPTTAVTAPVSAFRGSSFVALRTATFVQDQPTFRCVYAILVSDDKTLQHEAILVVNGSQPDVHLLILLSTGGLRCFCGRLLRIIQTIFISEIEGARA